MLYINNGDGTYTNKIDVAGIPLEEWGWSNVFVDFDNDGDLDFFFAGAGGAGFTNANRGTLAFNDGTGKFTEAKTCGPSTCAGLCTLSSQCFQTDACAVRDQTTGEWRTPSEDCNAISGLGCDGCYRESECPVGLTPCEQATDVFLSSSLSCGVAHGDFDGDGFDEIAIMTADYSADRGGDSLPGIITNVVLLKNEGNSNNYLTVRPIGTTSNRGGVGAILIASDGVNMQYREVRSGNSPHSDSQLWPSFGLGERDSADITIRWPSGIEETFTDVQANMITELIEGSALPSAAPSTAPSASTAPSTAPTSASAAPTGLPTASPTSMPTATPTGSPSASPSFMPSDDASILGGTWQVSTLLVVAWSLLQLIFV